MLTPRQAAFVAEYVKDENATQAAIRAGYSEATAYSQGSRLLKSVEVKQALDAAYVTATQRVAQAQQEAVGSAEWVIRNAAETHKEARADGQFGPAVSALALLAKRHPEFRDNAPVVDQSQHIHFPEGMGVDEIRAMLSQAKQIEGGA